MWCTYCNLIINKVNSCIRLSSYIDTDHLDARIVEADHIATTRRIGLHHWIDELCFISEVTLNCLPALEHFLYVSSHRNSLNACHIYVHIRLHQHTSTPNFTSVCINTVSDVINVVHSNVWCISYPTSRVCIYVCACSCIHLRILCMQHHIQHTFIEEPDDVAPTHWSNKLYMCTHTQTSRCICVHVHNHSMQFDMQDPVTKTPFD